MNLNDNKDTVLSVVIPLFNEDTNIDPLMGSLNNVLSAQDISYEIILVDDGSRDKTWSKIKACSAGDSRIKGISLSRNFGHQYAIFAGLHYSAGEAIVTMDGDLQHPPEIIPDLIKAWRDGFKVVNTCRIESRKTSLFKRMTSRWFYRVFSLLSGMPVAGGSSDFRLVDKEVAGVIKDMRDADLFLRGIVHWVGFPATTIEFQASDRYSGTTKFSLIKMIRFSVAALLSFSLVPLKMGIWLGLITSLIAFAEFLYIIVRFLQGVTVPGWASILTVISFMFGVLFILIGMIGAYLGSIFETLKNRPRFLINEMSGFTHRNR